MSNFLNIIYPPPKNVDDYIFNANNFIYVPDRGPRGATGGGSTGPTGGLGSTGSTGMGSTGPTGMMGATGAVIYPLVGQQMVRLQDNNGYGSIYTGVRRFLTTVVNTGTDITYTDSATLGASFTINTSGVYGISYVDNFPNGTDMMLTLNSTTFSGVPSNLNQIIAFGTQITDYKMTIAVSVYLNAGDIVRAQQHNVGGPSNQDYTFFCITRTDAGGSKGDTGPTGAGGTGPPGSATNTGATGPPGVTGATGMTGYTGIPGSATNTGATGPTGDVGPQGPAGTTNVVTGLAAIGSYAFLSNPNLHPAYTPGITSNGSFLRYAPVNTTSPGAGTTWQLMGHIATNSPSGSVWVRIS